MSKSTEVYLVSVNSDDHPYSPINFLYALTTLKSVLTVLDIAVIEIRPQRLYLAVQMYVLPIKHFDSALQIPCPLSGLKIQYVYHCCPDTLLVLSIWVGLLILGFSPTLKI